MGENERFGTIVVDGKVINLDTTEVKDLKELEEKLKKEVEQKKKKIKNDLDLDDKEL